MNMLHQKSRRASFLKFEIQSSEPSLAQTDPIEHKDAFNSGSAATDFVEMMNEIVQERVLEDHELMIKDVQKVMLANWVGYP